MSKKKLSASSGRWLQEHFNDPYVARAQKEGWRSRAVFKLEEINEKERLIKPSMTIVDLGAAPGGWSQYVASILYKESPIQHRSEGQIIACDILPMDPLHNVHFLQGDFREQSVLDELLKRIQPNYVDLILSDMAPNMSGNNTTDQAQSIYLVELALEMCDLVLKENGSFVVKVFQGDGFDHYFSEIKKRFTQVKTRKPKASRDRSREVYIIAKGYKQSK